MRELPTPRSWDAATRSASPTGKAPLYVALILVGTGLTILGIVDQLAERNDHHG